MWNAASQSFHYQHSKHGSIVVNGFSSGRCSLTWKKRRDGGGMPHAPWIPNHMKNELFLYVCLEVFSGFIPRDLRVKAVTKDNIFFSTSLGTAFTNKICEKRLCIQVNHASFNVPYTDSYLSSSMKQKLWKPLGNYFDGREVESSLNQTNQIRKKGRKSLDKMCFKYYCSSEGAKLKGLITSKAYNGLDHILGRRFPWDPASWLSGMVKAIVESRCSNIE